MKAQSLKKVILIIFLLPSIISAQQLTGVVSYKYVLNLFGVPNTQVAKMYFNNTESIFVHSKGKKGSITTTEDGKLWDGESFHERFGGWYQDTIGAVIFKNLAEKKLIFREFLSATPYVTVEPNLPIQTWEITPEKKKIGKFTCQKAKTKFRGRNYEAWFTTEIPINNGPWKFQGLPGLILEAYDDKREVQFLFESVEIPATGSIKIQPALDGKNVDFATYKKADDVEYAKWKKRGESIDIGGRGKIVLTRPQKHTIELEYEQ